MGEERRPFAFDDEEDTKRCCLCNCVTTLKVTRKELQEQRGCGCLGYHPRWMKRLADIRVFVLVICLYWLLYTTMEYYLLAVITTIEKRFGYSSSHSGFLLSLREIAYVLVVTAVSHFSRNFHRPRFIAISGILGAIGGLVFAIPHFVYDRSDVILVNGKSELANQDLMCEVDANKWNVSQCNVQEDNGIHSGSYIFFAIGSCIIGIAHSPMTSLSLTYVDDAVGPKRASLLIGFMNMMRPLGPVLGFFFGGIFTSIYETLHDPGFGQTDPRWIGAWWIGYIVIPILLLVPIMFLPMFPYRIPRDPIKDADYSTSNGTTHSIRNQRTITQVRHSRSISYKDFCSSIYELLRNPVYMSLQLGGCLSAFVISGLFPFIPKYMEVMFHLTASFANIISGIVSALMAVFGVLVGGLLSSHFKWTPKQSAILILCIDGLFTLGVILLIPIQCPNINLTPPMSMNNSCLTTCHCTPDQFHPVCGEDHRTYLSPCEAGCFRSHINNTWSQCGCVSPGGGVVTSGVCNSDCKSWIPFAIIMAVCAFVLMMGSVPATNIVLRSVKEKHRAIAFGFSGTLLAFTSSVPGPLIYGSIIDSTCIVWRESCGQREECLLYNGSQFSSRALGATVGFKLVAAIFYVLLYISIKRRERNNRMDPSTNNVRYNGANSLRVETATFRDNQEVQLRV